MHDSPEPLPAWFNTLTDILKPLVDLQSTDPIAEVTYLLHQLFQQHPTGIVLVDMLQPDMPIVFVNETFERLTGYAASEVIGRNCRFLQGTDRDQEGIAVLRNAIRRGESCAVALRNYRKDGSLFWNRVQISPIRNRAGVITHYRGTQQDITKQVEAHAALARSESRYRQVFESNSAVKLVLEPATGKIVDANIAAANFYGYTQERLRTMRIQDLNVLPEEQVLALLTSTANNERSYLELQHRIASGEVRDVDVYTSPFDLPEGRFIHAIVIDVTGRREGASRYRALFEQSNDAVFILDLEGTHLQVNQRAADMLGYSPDELVGLSLSKIVNPNEVRLGFNVLERILAGERVPPYERTFRRKDGTDLSAEVNVEVVRASDGTPLHIQSIVRDISERRRLEASLIQSEARYRAAIEASTDAYYLLESVRDPQGVIVDFRIVQINENAIREMGLPRERLIGGLICELFPINITAGYFERYKHVVETGEALEEEFVIPDPHAAPGWYYHQVVRVGDGIAIMSRDITPRKRAEEALRVSEERYRLIAENTSDGIVVIDILGQRVLYATPSYERLLGYPEGQSVQSSLATAAMVIHPDDRTAIRQQVANAINRHLETLTTSYRCLHKTDGYFWREDHTKFTYTPEGKVSTLYVISRDISARKEAEDRAFDLALEKERLRLLTQFIQNTAHEFRTPLSVISSSTYLMSRSNDADSRQCKAAQIEAEIKHVTTLLDGMLTMATLENPESLERNPIDLRSLLDDVCRRCISTYGTQPRLQCSIAPHLLTFVGDRQYLTIALNALLDNAYRYTPVTGNIYVSAGSSDDQVWLEIGDTGTGISEDELPHIFKTFWRHDDSHSTPGFGLGLAIAKRIIESHRGTITVESTLGAGSTFRIIIPAAR